MGASTMPKRTREEREEEEHEEKRRRTEEHEEEDRAKRMAQNCAIIGAFGFGASAWSSAPGIATSAALWSGGLSVGAACCTANPWAVGNSILALPTTMGHAYGGALGSAVGGNAFLGGAAGLGLGLT